MPAPYTRYACFHPRTKNELTVFTGGGTRVTAIDYTLVCTITLNGIIREVTTCFNVTETTCGITNVGRAGIAVITAKQKKYTKQ